MNGQIQEILNNGTKTEIRALFCFDGNTDAEMIRMKFLIFSRYFFPKFFEDPILKVSIKDADFHKDMDMGNINAYIGKESSFLNIAFRNSSKTTRTKLFITFAVLNDETHRKKFFKILSKDSTNSRKSVTDIYNLLNNHRIKGLYPGLFDKTIEKREETMSAFTMSGGIHITSDSVGTDQRGDIQDESRPDFLWFDDIETRMTLTSAQITFKLWQNMEEARTGLSKEGCSIYTANYLSERGNVHKLVQKIKNQIIVPIEKDGKPTWDRFSKEDIIRLKKETDDFVGEYLCLKPDTLIYTESGLREIQTIKVGDRVWTDNNRLKKVLQVFQNEADDLIDITVAGKVTTITKNHPVLAEREGQRLWIPAGDLDIEDLLIIIPRGSIIDMDETYQFWKVLDKTKVKVGAYICVKCQCECGTIRMVRVQNLKAGISKSCGCVGLRKLKERSTFHNKRHDKIWRIWQAMKNRCYNQNVSGYNNYGGRGIQVCDEWRNSFIAFFKVVGDPPWGRTLDRINNDGNYEPGNVRWATKAVQSRNRRSNRKINGVCISDISIGLGGAASLVDKRLKRGWSVDDAVNFPLIGKGLKKPNVR